MVKRQSEAISVDSKLQVCYKGDTYKHYLPYIYWFDDSQFNQCQNFPHTLERIT